jgi:hypothetical protein
MQEIRQALDEGFRATDVRSDAAGVEVVLRRGSRSRTVHLDRDDARRLLNDEEPRDEVGPWIL